MAKPSASSAFWLCLGLHRHQPCFGWSFCWFHLPSLHHGSYLPRLHLGLLSWNSCSGFSPGSLTIDSSLTSAAVISSLAPPVVFSTLAPMFMPCACSMFPTSGIVSVLGGFSTCLIQFLVSVKVHLRQIVILYFVSFSESSHVYHVTAVPPDSWRFFLALIVVP